MQSPLYGTTAVLIFANSSQEELKRKPMAKGKVLFDGLLRQTLDTVQKTKLPYFHFSEEQQCGNSFGERFVNAIEAVFDQGYEHIITVGNDTPLLKASHILKTRQQIEAGKSVMGPSADGGFYMMGLHKSQFNPSAFKKLPWQTSKLSKAISSLLGNSKKTLAWLEILVDIDKASDIKAIVKRGYILEKNFLKLLLSIIASKKEEFYFRASFFDATLTKIHYNKGSPMVFSS